MKEVVVVEIVTAEAMVVTEAVEAVATAMVAVSVETAAVTTAVVATAMATAIVTTAIVIHGSGAVGRVGQCGCGNGRCGYDRQCGGNGQSGHYPAR